MKSLHYMVSIASILGMGACTDHLQPRDPVRVMNYIAPEGGDFRLVQNAELSTPEHLVLDLMGPASSLGHGVALFLTVDPKELNFATVSTQDLEQVQNGTVFNLGEAPQILAARQMEGGRVLQAVVCEKGRATAKPLGGALLRVAFVINPETTLASGSPLTLTAPTGKSQILLSAASPQATQTIDVKVGRVILQEH